MTLDSTDSIVSEAKYLGDSSKHDWVYSDGSQVLEYNDNLLLTMPANSSGTVLASTVYMWYGNVKATLKSSRGDGVVTAFILLSDVKDEVDFEFIGADLETVQTNYYFQADPICESASPVPSPPLLSHRLRSPVLPACRVRSGRERLENPSATTHTDSPAGLQTLIPRTSPMSPTHTATFTHTRSTGRPIPLPGSSMVWLAAR